MPCFWDNLTMNFSHITKLDMDSLLTSLLSKELRRNSLETTTSSLGLQALISEENNDKARVASNNKKGKGKFNPKEDIKCIIVLRWVI